MYLFRTWVVVHFPLLWSKVVLQQYLFKQMIHTKRNTDTFENKLK